MLKSSDGSWSEEQENVLMYQYPLHHACRDSNANSLKQVLLCLQQNVSNSNLVLAEDSEYGWTAAHFAAYFGSLQCLRLLQEAGQVLNSSRQSAGLPPLPCPLRAVTSRWGQTLLHVAAFAARPQCLQWLLQCGGVVGARDKNGETALHKACRSGTWDCIQLLLEAGADVSDRNAKGCSTAELAVTCGYQHIAERLLQHVSAPAPSIAPSIAPSTAPSTAPPLSHMVSSNGYYGFTAAPTHLANNNAGHACAPDVEMEADISGGNGDGAHAAGEGAPRGADLLMNEGVALDTIPVAGRKRGREEEECQQSKRGRYQDGVCLASSPALHDLFGGTPSFIPNTHPHAPQQQIERRASAAPSTVCSQADEGLASPCNGVWRSRGERMSGNSTDSQDSGFCGYLGDHVGSANLASGSTISSTHSAPFLINSSTARSSFANHVGSANITFGSTILTNHSGSFLSNSSHAGCGASSPLSTASSASTGNGWLLQGSLDAPMGLDMGSVSSTSGCSGCPIPAPAHLLACSSGSGGRSRKLFGGHMF